MKSLKIFLITTLLATITLINFIAALQGYRNAMQQTQDLLDAHLEQYMQLLITEVVQSEKETSASPILPIKNRAELIYQITNIDGHVISRSENAPRLALFVDEDGYKEINHAGYRWHAISHFLPKNNIRITVAERADLRYQVAESIVLESVLPILLGLPILAIIIYFIIRIGLNPVTFFAEQLRNRQADNLSPITLENEPEELHMLVESTNNLLTRLKASFEREKRFASDAAHELRTPISALSLHIENALSEINEPPDSLKKAQQSIQRLNHIVEQILVLNRTSAEQYMAKFSQVDLFDIIKLSIENYINQINTKNHNIEFDGHHAQVRGDQFSLEILVGNLLDNAIKYTPNNGNIAISLNELNEQLIMNITDSGPGIPEDQHDQIFERFYRLGGDRHNSGIAGCGLGLSIVKHIVALHNAEIHLNNIEKGGLHINIIFQNKPPNAKSSKVVK